MYFGYIYRDGKKIPWGHATDINLVIRTYVRRCTLKETAGVITLFAEKRLSENEEIIYHTINITRTCNFLMCSL